MFAIVNTFTPLRVIPTEPPPQQSFQGPILREETPFCTLTSKVNGIHTKVVYCPNMCSAKDLETSTFFTPQVNKMGGQIQFTLKTQEVTRHKNVVSDQCWPSCHDILYQMTWGDYCEEKLPDFFNHLLRQSMQNRPDFYQNLPPEALSAIEQRLSSEQ